MAAANDALLISIDPDPAPATKRLAKANEHLQVVAGASPGALEGLEAADLYVIDGDHNYWTVFSELEAAFGGEHAPLAILHDIGWPSGRRDMYYAPTQLPEEAVHAHSMRDGAVPDKSELVEGGFRGAGAFAWALEEGGERNGVLTAVEDLLKQRDDLKLIRIPSVFGVGFVFSSDSPWAAELERRLAPLDDLELLRVLEDNRLHLYLALIEAQDQLETERKRMHLTLEGMRSQLDALVVENLKLKHEAPPATSGDVAQDTLSGRDP